MPSATGGRVRIVFEGDSSSLEAAVRRSDAAMSKFSTTASSKYVSSTKRASTQTSDLDTRTRRLGAALSSVTKFAVGAAAAYIGIAEAKAAITTTEDLAKATKSLSENLGLSVRQASQWAAVAKSREVDSAKLGMAFKTLATQVTSARDGSESAVKSFHRLGLSNEEIAKGAKDTNFLLGEVADGLGNLAGGADKAAISGRLFGRGWQTVQPVLRDGSDAMNEQLKLANQYGAAFGGKTLDSISDLIAAQRELKLAQLGLQVQFTEHIAPALIDAGLAMARFIKQMRTGKGAGGEFVDVMGDIWKVVKVVAKEVEREFKIIAFVVRHTANVIEFSFGLIRGAVEGGVKGFRFFARTAGRVVKGTMRVFGAFGRGVSGVAKGIMGAFRAVAHVVKSVVGFITDAINKLVNAIGDAKDAIESLTPSLPSLPSIPSPGDIAESLVPDIHFARGGNVPGAGDGDKVPAMLEPGEFVVNKKATSMFRSMLEGINTQAPRFGPTTVTSSFAVNASNSVRMQGGGSVNQNQAENRLRRLRRQLRQLERRFGRGMSDAPTIRQWQQQQKLESQAVATEQYIELLKEQAEHLRNLRQLSTTQRGQLAKALASVVMGEAGQTVGLGLQTPSVAGRLARY